jgi:hypothetical protein
VFFGCIDPFETENAENSIKTNFRRQDNMSYRKNGKKMNRGRRCILNLKSENVDTDLGGT